jgi:hypothetical protein
LTAARVPEKVMVASAVPSPAVNVSPVSPESVSVPLVEVSVTRTVAASTSATLSALPPALDSTSGAFITVICAAGTVLTGASLTAVSVILLMAALLSLPPGIAHRDRDRAGR